MTLRTSTLGRLVALIALLVYAAAHGNENTSWSSQDGLYRLSYTSALSPIVINRIHRWTLRVETSRGEPVLGARFSIRGGMPEHDHGLPTQPRVTQELGGGEYLLEGVRFHMTGSWEIEIRIEASAGNDTAIIALEL